MCSTSSVLRGGRHEAVAQVAEGRTYVTFTRPEEKALPILIERRSASSLFFCYHIVLCCALRSCPPNTSGSLCLPTLCIVIECCTLQVELYL